MGPAPTLKGRLFAMAGNRNGRGLPEIPDRDKVTDVPVPVAPLELSAEEVRQLWSFIHENIMDGGLRGCCAPPLGWVPGIPGPT